MGSILTRAFFRSLAASPRVFEGLPAVGGVQVILGLLTHADDGVRASAAQALGNLAARPQGRDTLFSSGVVSSVQPLLASPNPAVQKQGLFVLAQLSGSANSSPSAPGAVVQRQELSAIHATQLEPLIPLLVPFLSSADPIHALNCVVALAKSNLVETNISLASSIDTLC